MNSVDRVLAEIDQLERDEVDELVDWQLRAGPAARAQGSGELFRRAREIIGNQFDMQLAITLERSDAGPGGVASANGLVTLLSDSVVSTLRSMGLAVDAKQERLIRQMMRFDNGQEV